MRILYKWLRAASLILITTQCSSPNIKLPDKQTSTNVPGCNRIAPPGTGLIEEVLCAHNAVRAAAVPAPAPQLPPLKWDDGLAAIAKAYAEQCRFAHNPDRDNAGFGPIGENLFITTAAVPPAYAAVDSWASEAAIYDYHAKTCQGREGFSGCGHYTQIVWRDTAAVGCGVAFCPTIKGRRSSYSNATIIVCNYSPPGNFIGEKPY